LIILDNHLHLRRDGRYIDAIKDFQNAGGTHFILCQLPMINKVIENKSYTDIYNITLKMAEEIKSKLDIGVFVTLGPYPVDYIKLLEKFGKDTAISIMKKGIDEVANICKEGKCIGIGEIGRPHFPVSEEIINDSNNILMYGMQKAKEVNVPVILHTESTTIAQCKDIVEMGKKVGLPANKIVKHYSPALVLPEENFGLIPSILASKKNIELAISKNFRFLMETDYIDDPKRPGAVLGPKTVPKRTIDLLEKGLLTEEDVYKIHKDLPEKTYNIDLNE